MAQIVYSEPFSTMRLTIVMNMPLCANGPPTTKVEWHDVQIRANARHVGADAIGPSGVSQFS